MQLVRFELKICCVKFIADVFNIWNTHKKLKGVSVFNGIDILYYNIYFCVYDFLMFIFFLFYYYYDYAPGILLPQYLMVFYFFFILFLFLFFPQGWYFLFKRDLFENVHISYLYIWDFFSNKYIIFDKRWDEIRSKSGFKFQSKNVSLWSLGFSFKYSIIYDFWMNMLNSKWLGFLYYDDDGKYFIWILSYVYASLKREKIKKFKYIIWDFIWV